VLKEKLAIAPIMVYLDWNKQFHVHINASGIALGVVLAQPIDGNLDHPVYISSRKLSAMERNYTTIEIEVLAMLYSLQKFQHYILGGPFKFFIDHFSLKYLVNKPIL